METEELIKLVDGIYKVSLSIEYTKLGNSLRFRKNYPPFWSLGNHAFGQDFFFFLIINVPKSKHVFVVNFYFNVVS